MIQKPDDSERVEKALQVLIVDDNEQVGRVLESGIRLHGYACMLVKNAKEALAVLDSRGADVVISDILLPDMNGLDLTEVIKRNYDADVIVITGYHGEYSHEQAVERGASDFLAKPVKLSELGIRLKRVFRERAILEMHRQAEAHQQLVTQILEILNQTEKKTDAIRDILGLIKEFTDTEAIGIRLREAEDFPYYETRGFTKTFIEAERLLCTRGKSGQLLRDEQGNLCFDCLCGVVLCGKTDPEQPFFTPGGSFWTNSTTGLLESMVHKELALRMRNRCQDEGYESVALIPLKSGGEIIGLLQLNDRRRGRFTLKKIKFLEGIGYSIGIAIKRKEAEEALKKSEKKYRELANSLPQVVFETDEHGNLTFTNRNAVKLFGYDQKDFKRGLNAFQMLAPEDRESAVQDLRRVLDGNGTGASEYTARRKNGETFPVIVHANHIPRDGKTVGIRGIVIDITERKRAEEEKKKLEAQLRQSHKLEAIGTLAGGIAHDFNNILGVIVGNTELALLDVPESNTAHQNLLAVRETCLRAKDLVKQILTFGRKGEFELGAVNIDQVIREFIKILRATIPTTIEISHHIQNDLAMIKADPTQLNQILLNLCTNAAHAMKESGGILKIGLKNTSLGVEDAKTFEGLKPGAFVRLTVSDTGCGIPPEIVGRIFDPYFTTKAVGEGTGMGLAVVQGIIKSYGGAITLESEPGRGTTFHVYLPASRKEIEKETSAAEPPTRGNERILFVDDERNIVDIAKKILERFGYEVVVAQNPVEALEIFSERSKTFDLVITDMTMPVMTGVGLSLEIRKIRPEIPIILSTGYSDQIDEERAKKLGIQAFVMKPIIMRELIATVRNILDSP